MKIYVSEKENIDLDKNCFLTFSTKDEQAVDWSVSAQSLEQHEEEIRKQEQQNVIAELEEWANRFNCGIYVDDTMVGYDTKQAKIINELKQKLNEMKEV